MAQVRNTDAGPVEVPAYSLHFAAGETLTVDDTVAAAITGGLIQHVTEPAAPAAPAAAPAEPATTTTTADTTAGGNN